MSRRVISVVVPAYNHDRFVQTAIQSVEEQDYPDIELIIVDDCSVDRTYEVCKDYLSSTQIKSRFNKIIITKNESNEGAHATLNKGINFASGDYITFLNSDDFYHPKRISSIVNAAQTLPAEFLFTAVKAVDDFGNILAQNDVTSPIERVLHRHRVLLPSLSFGFLGHQLTVSTGNLMVSRKLARRVGQFSNLRYCHDWDFALRTSCYVEPVYLPETLYYYRQHSSNSFKALQDVAAVESEYVLRRYFRSVKLGQVRNQLAPSPIAWPGVFDMFAKRYGVFKWWLAESGAYPNSSRMVDADANVLRYDN